jgi:hypothetical protein
MPDISEDQDEIAKTDQFTDSIISGVQPWDPPIEVPNWGAGWRPTAQLVHVSPFIYYLDVSRSLSIV